MRAFRDNDDGFTFTHLSMSMNFLTHHIFPRIGERRSFWDEDEIRATAKPLVNNWTKK